MSKAKNMRCDHRGLRWQLLVTVSAAALLASAYGAEATDNESDHPLLWIELGGQFEGLSDAQEQFAPPFVPSLAQEGIASPLRVQGPPRYGLDSEGKISFEPDGSDWIFSASIRYGRANGAKRLHQETQHAKFPVHFSLPAYNLYFNRGTYYPTGHVKFADAASKQSGHDLILDFQAGKDIGLGIFGGHGSSVLSAGVRIAQFSSKSNTSMRVEPDVHYPSQPITNVSEFVAFEFSDTFRFHDYAASMNSKRSFQGVGPSIAWDASAPFAGNATDGEITLDWGANAAVLFGRQKVKGHHQTTTRSYYKQGWHQANGHTDVYGTFYTRSVSQQNNAANPNRIRSVVVPNLGGFAGLSFRYSDAKISFGYRADFFFGAMDGGIDTRKAENRGFYGPFASISVGLGD